MRSVLQDENDEKEAMNTLLGIKYDRYGMTEMKVMEIVQHYVTEVGHGVGVKESVAAV